VAYYERQLPHWQPEEAWLFVTWRLAGSLPAIQTMDMNSPAVVPAGKAFVLLDRMLDRAPRRLCRLGGYVAMSNHVHLLALPLETAATLTHWVKEYRLVAPI